MAMLPWWIHYPNVNNEIINLDWILQISNENTDKIENFIGVNTIKYADPILWDITSQYEANTIVVDPQTGDAYISTKAVPYGVALSNDSYWTRIYNYASEVDTLRSQIAYNEQLSTTASGVRVINDLVFLNGLLYRVTAPMIAGDSYVEGSNCVKTTVNAELLRLHTSIGAEAEARAEADTALGGRIDGEIQAREDADTALGGRIDDEAEARAEADTALGGRIDDEAEARANADTALGQRIDDEAEARAEADAALGERITNIGHTFVEQSSGSVSEILDDISYIDTIYDGLYPATPHAQYGIAHETTEVSQSSANTPESAIAIALNMNETVADGVGLWVAAKGSAEGSTVFGENIIVTADKVAKLVGLEIDYEPAEGFTPSEGNTLILNTFNNACNGSHILIGGVNGGSMTDGITFNNGIVNGCIVATSGVTSRWLINSEYASFNDVAIKLSNGLSGGISFNGVNDRAFIYTQNTDFNVKNNDGNVLIGAGSNSAVLVAYSNGKIGTNSATVVSGAGSIAGYIPFNVNGTDYRLPLYSV